jgi:hypothetical protein
MIGVVTYLANIRVLDYDGLGTTWVTRRRLDQGRLSLDEATGVARADGAPIAIFGDLWLSSRKAPDAWQRVARFALPAAVYTSPAELGLYALAEVDRTSLEQRVRDYASQVSPLMEGRLAVDIVDGSARHQRLPFAQGAGTAGGRGDSGRWFPEILVGWSCESSASLPVLTVPRV